MKFSVYKVTSENNFEEIRSHTSILSDNVISVFHYNELNSSIIHVVFNIKDEYHFGSKIGGNQINVPTSQYINSFYNKENNLLFVENTTEKYCDEISNYLFLLNFDNVKHKFINEAFIRALEVYCGSIKKVELVNEYDETENFEVLKSDELIRKLEENLNISYLLMLSKDTYISMNDYGTLSINSQDIEQLIKYVGEFPYVESY